MKVRTLHPAANEGILSPQSTDGDLTEDDFRSQSSSQWSPTEGDAQSQWSATKEELEPQFSATKQEQLVTEGDHDVVIPQHSFILTSIWNLSALNQTVMGMRACFEQQATRVISHSPVASNSSSPLLYEHTYRPSSSSDENDDQHLHFISFGILDDQDVDLIDASFLPQVGYLINQHRIVEPGNPQNQLSADNLAMLDSYLYDHFASTGLSIDKWTCMDASEFTCQSANDCAMILKITTRLICLMSNKLAEAECESFDQDLRDFYFELCARQIVEGLIKAADSISKLKWPASHICQMLVLDKAIGDILPAIHCPSESDRILKQMRENFNGIFDVIKCRICDYLNGSQCTVSQVGHPVTKFLILSMELFASQSSTVQDTCIGDGSISLGHCLSKVISYWAEQLETHFMPYTQGRNYIVLLNNLTHFDEEAAEFLNDLMPSSDSISEPHCVLNSLIDMNTSHYLMECWGPLRNYVKLDTGMQPSWSSLDAFTSQFNIIYKRQKTWVLQTQLKRKLRQQIEEFLVPDYDAFLKKLQKRAFSRLKMLVQKHSAGQQAKYMTTAELRCALRGIFESEHKE